MSSRSLGLIYIRMMYMQILTYTLTPTHDVYANSDLHTDDAYANSDLHTE